MKLYKRPSWTGDDNTYTYRAALKHMLAQRHANGIASAEIFEGLFEEIDE